MGILRVAGRAFQWVPRLWMAWAVVLISTSALGSLASVLLPYEVVNGQVVVPPVTGVDQALNRGVASITLFLLSVGGALYLLGGTLGVMRQLLGGGRVSVPVYFQAAGRWFFPMIGWGSVWGLILVGASSVVGLLFGTVGMAMGRQELLKGFFGFGFLTTFFVLWVAFIFSPVVLVERSTGIWASFGHSVRFFTRRPFPCIALILCAVLVGVVCRIVGLALNGVVGGLRGALGVAPYARGFPVFWFNLILGIPQSYLAVYFPVLLYAYFHSVSEEAS